MSHSLRWDFVKQRYGCLCGEVLYQGGEKAAYKQHRAHKAGIKIPAQAIRERDRTIVALASALEEYADERNHAENTLAEHAEQIQRAREAVKE